MAANSNPIFKSNYRVGSVEVATANTSRDTGTGVWSGAILTGGDNGTIIERVVVKALNATTAGMIRLALNQAGSNAYLVAEIPVGAATPSATVQSFEVELVRTDGLPWLTLSKGDYVMAATANAEAIRIFLLGGDL